MNPQTPSTNESTRSEDGESSVRTTPRQSNASQALPQAIPQGPVQTSSSRWARQEGEDRKQHMLRILQGALDITEDFAQKSDDKQNPTGKK